jgi:hypothetical protein
MSEFLVWPGTPRCKGKRQVKKEPFAITSGKYKEVFEKKHVAKACRRREKARMEKEA